MNSSQKRPGLLFTLVGPAGAGKNRLMKHVLAHIEAPLSLHQLPTATTRPIRSGEQQGREHDFVSLEKFQQMLAAGELLEHQVIHGNLYGMPLSAVEAALDSGRSIIADIEVLGAREARLLYPENVVSIFIQAPSIGSLIDRMRERRETQAEIGKRLLRVPMELDYSCECDYIILNDSFERAADKLTQIVTAELRGEHPVIQGDPLLDYHFRFDAQIIPIYHDQALIPTTTSAFTWGEMPQRAALQMLRNELNVEPREDALITDAKLDGNYLPPNALEYRQDDYGEHVTYVYLYRLDQRVAAPAGWSWTPVASLPETLRAAVLERAR